ncbi:hypothetical protein O1L55_17565 [Streptomyces albulus]|nr:hypothetical protein [Streptomyces noursei]
MNIVAPHRSASVRSPSPARRPGRTPRSSPPGAPRGPRPVRGQLQRDEVGQPLLPEPQLSVELAVRGALALPVRVVLVPDGQVGVLRRPAVEQRPVAVSQFLPQQRHGPAVRGDVVHDEDEEVMFVFDAQKACPEQRAGAQVEARPGRLAGQLRRPRFPLRGRQFPQIHDRQRNGLRGQHHGVGPSVAFLEDRA